MEINKHQGIVTQHQLISSSNFLKLFTKILLPFSVLYVLLSYPLLCNFHIWEYGLQLFSFSVGKNYMFLLCNGLLVFIATSSGLMGSFETDSKDQKALHEGGSQRDSKVESSEQKGSIAKAEVEQKPQASKMDSLTLLVQEKEDVPLVVQDGGDEQRQELVSVEEDEDEGLEDLNKKCEEFIREMKEKIKIEAQQLIMVQ
ncbi:hypothetical protein DITRI_Ditri11bG0047700 [Diplodiscus trichospermus]